MERTCSRSRPTTTSQALLLREGKAGLALADVTTGQFLARDGRGPERTLFDELARMAPPRWLCPRHGRGADRETAQNDSTGWRSRFVR